jgi:hypothetical protein
MAEYWILPSWRRTERDEVCSLGVWRLSHRLGGFRRPPSFGVLTSNGSSESHADIGR